LGYGLGYGGWGYGHGLGYGGWGYGYWKWILNLSKYCFHCRILVMKILDFLSLGLVSARLVSSSVYYKESYSIVLIFQFLPSKLFS
jgi:hypothetical protein